MIIYLISGGKTHLPVFDHFGIFIPVTLTEDTTDGAEGGESETHRYCVISKYFANVFLHCTK